MRLFSLIIFFWRLDSENTVISCVQVLPLAKSITHILECTHVANQSFEITPVSVKVKGLEIFKNYFLSIFIHISSIC